MKFVKLFSAFIDLDNVTAVYREGTKIKAVTEGETLILFEGAEISDAREAFIHLALTLDDLGLMEVPEGEILEDS